MKQMIHQIFCKKKLLWIPLTLLLTFVITASVINSFYLLPALAAAQTKWGDIRNRIASSKDNDVATLYKSGSTDIATLKGRIAAKQEFPKLLSDLFETADSDHVSVATSSYKPNLVKEMPNLLTYDLSISVNGNYASIKNFLVDMQRQQEMIVIDSVSIANSDLFAEHLTMELRMTVYLQEAP